MKRSLALRLALVVVAGALLAGCAPAASDAPAVPAAEAPSPAATVDEAFAPTVVSPDDLDGKSASVKIGTSLVLAVPDGTEAEWTGTTSDVDIAEFSAGGPSEGSIFRPGFLPRAVGETAATLTGPDGKIIRFTLSVLAP
ncbi:hypothetical protein [Microbacterium testaceum]|uniref:hypothetical protein n=1 Tax=Microbacterium testaceum TaxID=2033 RepID=UPI001248B225|nr:hypothetical protein [Microbacterium testaceum]